MPNKVKKKFCFYCGKKLTHKNTTKDHVVPITKGGSFKKKNIVQACKGCNRDKGCLSLEEFRCVMAFRDNPYVFNAENWNFPGEEEEKDE